MRKPEVAEVNNVKKKRAIILIIAAAALVICLLGWRLWPHSLSAIISVEKNALTSIACQVAVSGNENGKPFIDSYTLSELSPQDTGFGEIVEILDSSDYRQDFRNLLPWRINSVGSVNTSVNTYLSASVVLVWGNGENDSCFISLHGESIIAVSLDTEAGLKIYHPTNREMLGALVEYMQAHGNEE